MTADDARRRARRGQLAGGAFLAVMVLVGGLIAFGVFGGGDPADDASVTGGVRGVDETHALLRGVPQHGITLGDPDAPATIVVFADLKCSACRSFVLQPQATVIRDLVRTGKANVELRLLAIKRFGPDTAEGRTAAHRLAAADRMWPFAELLFYNQQSESLRWITATGVRRIVAASPDLRGTAVSFVPTPASRRLDAEADALSQQLDVQGTPAVFVRRRGATAPSDHRPVDFGRFEDPAGEIRDAVAALAGS